MNCDKCHISQASVVVNHVVNGRAEVLHFCDKCAEEQGLLGGKMFFKLPMPNFGLVVPTSFLGTSENSLRTEAQEAEFHELITKPFLEKSESGETYLEKKIAELQREKRKAVQNEDYRSAAMLRDRIKELEMNDG